MRVLAYPELVKEDVIALKTRFGHSPSFVAETFRNGRGHDRFGG